MVVYTVAMKFSPLRYEGKFFTMSLKYICTDSDPIENRYFIVELDLIKSMIMQTTASGLWYELHCP